MSTPSYDDQAGQYQAAPKGLDHYVAAPMTLPSAGAEVHAPAPSADEFMSSAPQRHVSGNTAWAERYAGEIRRVFETAAAEAPRQVQVHLGPSEIGHECARQVAGKLAGLPATNHVVDPWPSIVGTACHAWAADAFQTDNQRRLRAGVGIRWLTEFRVHPLEGHSGTGDLYDGIECAVDDHKFLGQTSMAKVRSLGGPPRHYVVQLLLYGIGFRKLGLPVKRSVLIAYPRTAGSLDGMYVWERPHTGADDELIHQVTEELAERKRWAAAIMAGQVRFRDVPAVASDSVCYLCPFYRPQAWDGGEGCPGHSPPR